ncbi:MAG TPA: hypothetical protein VFM58_13150 [Solirubrobacteraceae bacterium]|jgi:hypothetical protein|nr:hypothetical protein [Solirubrobacteraceae bacterium]
MDFEFLFKPVEGVDAWLAGLLDGAPLLIALLIAFALGLRHASDPDHLVAVTSLVAADDGDVRGATRLGAWWGLGHAGTLLVVGLPLIALTGELPRWLERGAETAVGVVIVLLAVRVIYRWRHPAHTHRVRSRGQAFGIGLLHGLAGTGAVVVLLIAAMPGRLEAAAALAVFAPMSVLSMAACTSAFAWALTRPAVAPLYRVALLPALGVFGLAFGLWYVGLA